MESNDHLERSLRLLDDALGSPRTSTALSWGQRMDQQKSDKEDFAQLDFSKIRRSDVGDLSITVNPGELTGLYEASPTSSRLLLRSDMSATPLFMKSRAREDLNDLSVTMKPGEMTQFLDGLTTSSISQQPVFKGVGRYNMSRVRDLSITLNTGELDSLNTTMTGQPVLREESDQLYKAFLESLQNHHSTSQVFDTIANFVQNCSNMLDVMRDTTFKGHRNTFLGSTKQDVRWLEMERNNWRLFYCLYQNRLSSSEDVNVDNEVDMEIKSNDVNMEVGEIPHYFSEKEVIQKLYKRDNGIRECQLVVDWLEKNAEDEYEGCVKPQLGHYMDKTVAWENTLHQLQNKDIVYTSSRPILTSLDPDAPLRHGEKGHLHDLDIEDESRLLSQVFLEIRCGRIEKAQEICSHCGQSWRAATLSGWQLHHDPNYSNHSKLDKLPVEGNPHRDIWKLMAWKLAEDQRAPAFARAIHGILCGNISSVLPVCKGWEDFLWAYTKVFIDIRVEKEIRSNIVKQYAEMPDFYWNFKMTLPEIFSELAASKQSEVHQDAQSPERVIQKLLILNKIPELMTMIWEWVKSGDCSHQLIRYFAHLVLTLRLVGQGFHEEKGNEVLKAYVQVLMQQNDPQLVAYYTATLPQEDQVTLYADFLESITDSTERRSCLEAAEMVELQVEAITRRVVENIRNKERADDQLHLELINQTTQDDLEKISALDWVVMYPQQSAEAMWQANALIRRFLTVGKLEAARMAINKIPFDSVEMVINQHQVKLDSLQTFKHENLPPKVAKSLREFICHKLYLVAQEGFSDWFQHYHNAKPKAPAKPKEGASFTDQVAYDHMLAQYNKEFDRWKATMTHQTKSVKSQLYNVLMFPEGGWLTDGNGSWFEQDENVLRQQQMDSLRSLCIPKIVLLLHTVLSSMGELMEALQLADIIMSEQYNLYQVYNKQQLRELLAILSDTSLGLLDQGKDSWGCPATS